MRMNKNVCMALTNIFSFPEEQQLVKSLLGKAEELQVLKKTKLSFKYFFEAQVQILGLIKLQNLASLIATFIIITYLSTMICIKVKSHQSTRQRLSADMADHSGVIRSLVVRTSSPSSMTSSC